MIQFEFNGKPFDPRTFEETLLKQVMEAAAEQLRERIGTIRNPENGEFPTIVVSGTSSDALALRIEGSSALLTLVHERLALTSGDPSENEIMPETTRPPKVFLSYASEDRVLASRIAHQLNANGVDTWWDQWCLSAGDSLRQKIDEGLGDCTHFVVLLTSHALTKPWVNQEIDAGLMLKLGSQVTFIPLRHKLAAAELPPLLSGLVSPVVDDPDRDITQLIHDIHGVAKKPPLGNAPLIVTESRSHKTGYSDAANAIARVFVMSSTHGRKFDPNVSLDELKQKTGLPDDDITDALHELKTFFLTRPGIVWPEDELFCTFDQFWQPWNPRRDALQIAADMVNNDDFPTSPTTIAARYSWAPRRLNPAMAYLINRQLVRFMKAMDSGDWLAVHIQKIDATRRFIKSGS